MFLISVYCDHAQRQQYGTARHRHAGMYTMTIKRQYCTRARYSSFFDNDCIACNAGMYRVLTVPEAKTEVVVA
jgi:hypothetical protein